jgi:hypothetical protein
MSRKSRQEYEQDEPSDCKSSDDLTLSISVPETGVIAVMFLDVVSEHRCELIALARRRNRWKAIRHDLILWEMFRV